MLALLCMLDCFAGMEATRRINVGRLEPTFQDDTLIVRIHCFRAHLASYRLSPTVVKGKTALPSGNFVTSKCF